MNKSAVICPIKNETKYISKFLEYYSRHLPNGGNDIWILNFDSDKEYLKEYIHGKAMVINSNVDIWNPVGVFDEIKKNIKLLRKKGYDYIIPLDVDEFIVYNKEGGLKKYLENLDKDYVTCSGYEIIHIPELQEPFDYSKKWCDQFEYWCQEKNNYNKTVISKIDLNWCIGFHAFKHDKMSSQEVENDEFEKYEVIDNNLFLLHLHKIDYQSTIKKHLDASKLEWSKDNNYNWHYRIKELPAVKKWYFTPILNKRIHEVPKQILEKINI